jgi:hypothetical protein
MLSTLNIARICKSLEFLFLTETKNFWLNRRYPRLAGSTITYCFGCCCCFDQSAWQLSSPVGFLRFFSLTWRVCSFLFCLSNSIKQVTHFFCRSIFCCCCSISSDAANFDWIISHVSLITSRCLIAHCNHTVTDFSWNRAVGKMFKRRRIFRFKPFLGF